MSFAAGVCLVCMEMTATGASPTEERALLERAQGGDEAAFASLVDPYRGELQAHCYRMLGSVHDAEDALQETLLRAWRALAKFEGRSSLRSWLYTIATNTSLNAIAKRPKRVLPVDYAPAADPHDGPREPLVESVWVEPLADETLEIEDGYTSPEARYEQLEGVELAFIAALQHLPANQRAALILREVLGFSAKECAAMLDTSTASINSALQRARKTVEDRLPEKSQQETLRMLGEDRVREIVDGYVDAWQRGDVEQVVSMLTEDAAFSMPPTTTWFGGPDGGREEIATFLAEYPLNGRWRWRPIQVRANGQPALAYYAWNEEAGAYLPFALNVLTLRGERIADVTAFIVRSTEDTDPEVLARFPEQDFEQSRLAAAFGNFGLPERLD
ncbi:MAG: sigma-70 family RNA polymerase sigma factor [Solirubrobacterales bacterium]